MAYDSLERKISAVISYVDGEGHTVEIIDAIKTLKITQIATSAKVLKMSDFCSNLMEFVYYTELMPEKNVAWNKKKINLYFEEGGVRTQYGCYYVLKDDVITKDNGRTYTVKAYDLPPEMFEEFKGSTSGTASDIVSNILNKCGLGLADKSHSFELGKITAVPEGTSNAGMIALIGGYEGKNVRMNREGKVEFYWFGTNDSEAKLTVGRNVQFLNAFTNSEGVQSLNAIASGAGGKDGVITVGSGTPMTFVNRYMTEPQLQKIFNKVKGFSYNIGSMRWHGNPLVQAGDTVKAETEQGKYVLFPICENVVSYDGGMSMQSSSYTYEVKQTVMGKGSTDKKLDIVYDGLKHEFQQQSDLINGLLKNGYYRLLQDADTKHPYGWQIADSENIMPNTKGWRWTYGGLMFSEDGFRTASKIAFDMNGNLNGNIIKANSIAIGQLGSSVTNKIDSANNNASNAMDKADIAQQGVNDLGATVNKAVSSVIIEYYSSTSKTVQTGGYWNVSKPMYDKDRYIWQRITYVLKDGSKIVNAPECITGDVQDEIHSLNQTFYADSSGAYVKDSISGSYTHIDSEGLHIYVSNKEVAYYTSTGGFISQLNVGGYLFVGNHRIQPYRMLDEDGTAFFFNGGRN